MAIIKAENNNKTKQKTFKKENKEVSLSAQELLVETLNDSPHLVSLAGTEWEVRSLRFGTQYLVAQEVIKINKAENATFGDIVKQFAVNIPSVVKVITLCVLNDKNRIFEGGIETRGFSQEYKALYDTILWEGNINEYGNLLLECLQMLDVSAFMESHRILEMFREMTMTRKRTLEQK